MNYGALFGSKLIFKLCYSLIKLYYSILSFYYANNSKLYYSVLNYVSVNVNVLSLEHGHERPNQNRMRPGPNGTIYGNFKLIIIIVIIFLLNFISLMADTDNKINTSRENRENNVILQELLRCIHDSIQILCQSGSLCNFVWIGFIISYVTTSKSPREKEFLTLSRKGARTVGEMWSKQASKVLQYILWLN